MRKFNEKGFTLAELLIVVAIIAVLVAVSIPVFTTQLEKSREETDIANLRSAYAIAQTSALTGDYKVNSAAAYAPGTGFAINGSGQDAAYYSYYDISKGTLDASTTTKAQGKGTSAKGGSDSLDGPMYYSPGVAANNGYLMVVIKDEDGVPKKVAVGFAQSSGPQSGLKGDSSDFMTPTN